MQSLNTFKAVLPRTKCLMLRDDARAVKKSSAIVKLDIILLNRILRVGGCLHHSSISLEARHPAILPKHHYISDFIAQHYHQISGHSGLEHTLSLIRQRYWVIQARVSLCRILSSCFSCRRRQSPLFSDVSVDCFDLRFGPLFSKAIWSALDMHVYQSDSY